MSASKLRSILIRQPRQARPRTSRQSLRILDPLRVPVNEFK